MWRRFWQSSEISLVSSWWWPNEGDQLERKRMTLTGPLWWSAAVRFALLEVSVSTQDPWGWASETITLSGHLSYHGPSPLIAQFTRADISSNRPGYPKTLLQYVNKQRLSFAGISFFPFFSWIGFCCAHCEIWGFQVAWHCIMTWVTSFRFWYTFTTILHIFAISMYKSIDWSSIMITDNVLYKTEGCLNIQSETVCSLLWFMLINGKYTKTYFVIVLHPLNLQLLVSRNASIHQEKTAGTWYTL